MNRQGEMNKGVKTEVQGCRHGQESKEKGEGKKTGIDRVWYEKEEDGEIEGRQQDQKRRRKWQKE
jgi:hypothetical protein